MQAIYDVLSWIDSNILWGIPVIALMVLAGIWLTIRTKFFQVRRFNLSLKHTIGDSIKQMKKKREKVR